KVLICGAFTFLIEVERSGIYAWMVTVVVSRELIITSLRSFMENRGATFGADWLGKIKMVLQCAALLAVFLALEYSDVSVLFWIKTALVYAMLAATALSGLQYLWRAAHLLRAYA